MNGGKRIGTAQIRLRHVIQVSKLYWLLLMGELKSLVVTPVKPEVL